MSKIDLNRFGKTNPNAEDKENCKAITCSDHLPHSGDPCYVCESSEEEFALILKLPGRPPYPSTDDAPERMSGD